MLSTSSTLTVTLDHDYRNASKFLNPSMLFVYTWLHVYAVVKLGITVNLGILGYLKIDRVISRFPVPVSQMVHRLDWKQFSIKTKSFWFIYDFIMHI